MREMKFKLWINLWFYYDLSKQCVYKTDRNTSRKSSIVCVSGEALNLKLNKDSVIMEMLCII